MRNVSIEDTIKIFNYLADNQYSPIWNLIEDFTCNGHEISVKSSNLLSHIVIDHRYESIANYIIVNNMPSIDYVKALLETPKSLS